MTPSRKYKLLKDLPSAKKGAILTRDDKLGIYTFDGIGKTQFKMYTHHYGEQKEVVENNPEWFEEVKEKEWEILTLKNKNTGALASYDKGEEGCYLNPMSSLYKSREYFVECFLKFSQWSIFSVRRIADNEVFTLGDMAYYVVEDEQARAFKIERFEVIKDVVYVSSEGVRKCILNSLRKCDTAQRPPLGIIPEWLWKEQREKELCDAMKRYKEVNKEIPRHWEDEYDKLNYDRMLRETKNPPNPPPPQKEPIEEWRKEERPKYKFEVRLISVDATEKIPLVMKAIENCLNNDDKIKPSPMTAKDFDCPMYTTDQLNQAEEAAFNAGRLKDTQNRHTISPHYRFVFKGFQDYKNKKD